MIFSRDNIECLVMMNIKVNEASWIWYSRLDHTSTDSIVRLIRNNLVRYLSKINFEKNKVCNACLLDKQTRSSFKPKNIISTTRPLELLHIDLLDPIKTIILDGK